MEGCAALSAYSRAIMVFGKAATSLVTAINDTSSLTAAASTWDSMFNLGSATLDKAVKKIQKEKV